MYIHHTDGRPRLKEFGREKKLFFRSLYEWCVAHRVCVSCRRNPAGETSRCEYCQDRRKQ